MVVPQDPPSPRQAILKQSLRLLVLPLREEINSKIIHRQQSIWIVVTQDPPSPRQAVLIQSLRLLVVTFSVILKASIKHVLHFLYFRFTYFDMS